MSEPIQLFKPSIGEEEIQAVTEVLKSGWIGLGPKTAEFEKKFAEYLGADHVVGTISCTAALDLAIKLLDPHPGDEIIVPAMTFISSAHAIVYNQCRPVFVDSDPETLNMSLEDVRRKITHRTRAIMVVHYSGRPNDMDKLKKIAGDIPIIEDCAHATGAHYKGRSVGTIGDFGCFSFHAVKNLTMGEGGALVVQDSKPSDRAKRLRWLGIDKGTWARTDKNKDYWWEYAVDEVGLKCHLNDILAAIGLVQLKKVDKLNAKRKEITERYREAFKDLEWLKMPPPDTKEAQSSWHICSARCQGVDRNDFTEYLKSKGIVTGVHYKPIHLYRCYGYQDPLPNAEAAFKEIVSLPTHPELSEKDIAKIIETIKAYKAG